MRAFLAIPLPARLRSELAAVGRAQRGLRAQAEETIHLTIRFLGEIPEPELAADAVEPVAAAHAAFHLELKGLGVFPKPRAARVVWVGLGEGAEAAGALARDVGAALGTAGFPPEDRPWHGHVTLGRFRTPQRFAAANPERVFGRTRADRLVLYRSELTPRGARHEPVREMSLGLGK